MIDIHCHLLPGVDDGAEDLDEAVAMARMAAAGGVGTVIATPHCNLPAASRKNYRSMALRDRFVALCRAVREANIDLNILPGAEIFCTPELPQLLQDRQLLTLAGSRYLLMEFYFDEELSFINSMLDHVFAHGLVPVIAHPERYEAVQYDLAAAEGWFHRGCLLQVNKGSIMGSLGRRAELTADRLLRHGLAHTVASDAHSFHTRTVKLDAVRSYLEQAYSPAYAKVLLEINPRRICQDQPVLASR